MTALESERNTTRQAAIHLWTVRQMEGELRLRSGTARDLAVAQGNRERKLGPRPKKVTCARQKKNYTPYRIGCDIAWAK